MYSLSQKFLLVGLLLGLGCGSVAAAPQAEFLFEVEKKSVSLQENIFERISSILFGLKPADDQLTTLAGVAVDAADNLYVADVQKGRIVVLDQKGKATGRADIGKGVLKHPQGVAVDSQNRVYVTDSDLNQLLIFGSDGTLAFALAGDGTEKGKLFRPSGVLVDEPGDKIIVADTGNHRLQVFDLNGNFLFFVGKSGSKNLEFRFPTFLAKDSQGKIYVVDTINSRVQILSHDLKKYLGQFGDYGDALGYFGRPKGIAIDAADRIYVADAIFNVISVFDKTTKPLMFFGETAKMKKGLYSPMEVEVNSKSEVIVSDSHNHRLVVYRLTW